MSKILKHTKNMDLLIHLSAQSRVIHDLTNDLVNNTFDLPIDVMIKNSDMLPQIRVSNFAAWSVVQEIEKLIQELIRE